MQNFEATPAGLAALDLTPRQHLLLCLGAIRGGRITEAQLARDYAAWQTQHGAVTRENVERWAATDFDLKVGLDVLKRRLLAECREEMDRR